jgi:hypothetical protein
MSVGKQSSHIQIITDIECLYLYIYFLLSPHNLIVSKSTHVGSLASNSLCQDNPPMSPSSENDSRRPKPSPGYFIVRTTGEVVPLIAVDELPRGTDLLGVPRSLDLEGTIGMLNLGLQRSSGSFYQIRGSRQKDGSINGDTHVSK